MERVVRLTTSAESIQLLWSNQSHAIHHKKEVPVSSDIDRILQLHRFRAESDIRAEFSEHQASHQFGRIARAIAMHGNNFAAVQNHLKDNGLSPVGSKFIEKAAASTLEDVWGTETGNELSVAFLNSIAQRSVFDLLEAYGKLLPMGAPSGFLASGAAIGSQVEEGGLKVVKRLNIHGESIQWTKVLAMIVATAELLRTGAEGPFIQELENQVITATNTAVLALLTNRQQLNGSGDAVADLELGLSEAVRSNHYVVAATSRYARSLALRSPNGRMPIAGGQFIDGVSVVEVDEQGSSERMIIIPTSRAAVWKTYLRISQSEEASVDMRDSPGSPAQPTSFFQTNSRGLLVERAIAANFSDIPVIEVG